jgi:hypothetical protein
MRLEVDRMGENSSLSADVLDRRERAGRWFESLQRRICAELE